MANTNVTLSNERKNIFSNQEKLIKFTHQFNIKHTDIAFGTGTEDTVTVSLGNTPSWFIVNAAAMRVNTAFAGTTALTAQVGTTTDPNNFIADTSVKTVAFVQPSTGMNTLATIAGSTATAAVELIVTFTNATGGSPSALTAGDLDVFLAIADVNTIG